MNFDEMEEILKPDVRCTILWLSSSTSSVMMTTQHWQFSNYCKSQLHKLLRQTLVNCGWSLLTLISQTWRTSVLNMQENPSSSTFKSSVKHGQWKDDANHPAHTLTHNASVTIIWCRQNNGSSYHKQNLTKTDKFHYNKVRRRKPQSYKVSVLFYQSSVCKCLMFVYYIEKDPRP